MSATRIRGWHTHPAAAVGAVVLALSLTGCAYVRTTQLDTFAGVDAIAEELDVESLGAITSTEYSGTTGYTEGYPDAPRLYMVITGDDVVVNAEARLANAGFERPAIQDEIYRYWERGDDRVTLELRTSVGSVASDGDEADDRPDVWVPRGDVLLLSIVAYPE